MAPVFPPLYLLSFRIPTDELLRLEREIGDPLVRDITEAEIVIGKVSTKRRAQFEFRTRGVDMEEVVKGRREVVRETEELVAESGDWQVEVEARKLQVV